MGRLILALVLASAAAAQEERHPGTEGPHLVGRRKMKIGEVKRGTTNAYVFHPGERDGETVPVGKGGPWPVVPMIYETQNTGSLDRVCQRWASWGFVVARIDGSNIECKDEADAIAKVRAWCDWLRTDKASFLKNRLEENTVILVGCSEWAGHVLKAVKDPKKWAGAIAYEPNEMPEPARKGVPTLFLGSAGRQQYVVDAYKKLLKPKWILMVSPEGAADNTERVARQDLKIQCGVAWLGYRYQKYDWKRWVDGVDIHDLRIAGKMDHVESEE